MDLASLISRKQSPIFIKKKSHLMLCSIWHKSRINTGGRDKWALKYILVQFFGATEKQKKLRLCSLWGTNTRTPEAKWQHLAPIGSFFFIPTSQQMEWQARGLACLLDEASFVKTYFHKWIKNDLAVWKVVFPGTLTVTTLEFGKDTFIP